MLREKRHVCTIRLTCTVTTRCLQSMHHFDRIADPDDAGSMVAKAASRWQLPGAADGSSNGTPLADVEKALDGIAPTQHAASWDNVGLLVGVPQQLIRWHAARSRSYAMLVMTADHDSTKHRHAASIAASALRCVALRLHIGQLIISNTVCHCSCALVTIDLTAAVLEEAAECDADLIIAYHPPIFSGIKRLTAAPLVQRAAAAGCAQLMRSIAVVSAPAVTGPGM
jgi:NIF3 (NGG1p interacting factor 3)